MDFVININSEILRLGKIKSLFGTLKIQKVDMFIYGISKM